MIKQLICVAQARVIAGRERTPHVCTIAIDNDSGNLTRICLPFASRAEMPIRRWSMFDVECDSDPSDTRDNTYCYGNLLKVCKSISSKDKELVHAHMIGTAVSERELNEARRSIGVLLPLVGSVEYYPENLDDKGLRNKDNCAQWRVYFPDVRIRVKGKRLNGTHFDKQLVDWSVVEALRKDVDPFSGLQALRHPYVIIGNLAHRRHAFIAISILSSPSPIPHV